MCQPDRYDDDMGDVQVLPTAHGSHCEWPAKSRTRSPTGCLSTCGTAWKGSGGCGSMPSRT